METRVSAETVEFPFIVSKRNSRATIYRAERSKAGRTYFEYRLACYDTNGKRCLESFADFDVALEAADKKLAALGRGLVDTTTLSGPHRLDYINAIKLLPPGVTLTDAANAFLQSSKDASILPIRVDELVASFIETRESETRHGRPASHAYMRDLRARLGRFAEAFQCDVQAITARRLEDWLKVEKQIGRNRFNTLRLVRTILRWAQKRGHLKQGSIPTDSIDLATPMEGEIGIFTPSELQALLRAAKPQMIPYLALGAFGGLRTAEIQRLNWSDLKMERGFIEVGRDKAKTRSRRLIPILPVLKAWLSPLRQDSGDVLPYANVAKQVGWLGRDASVEWKHNGLRHSFISYRLAEIQSADRVALEAGNSPDMIFRHYRELVTPTDATAWFSIYPDPTESTPTKTVA